MFSKLYIIWVAWVFFFQLIVNINTVHEMFIKKNENSHFSVYFGILTLQGHRYAFDEGFGKCN